MKNILFILSLFEVVLMAQSRISDVNVRYGGFTRYDSNGVPFVSGTFTGTTTTSTNINIGTVGGTAVAQTNGILTTYDLSPKATTTTSFPSGSTNSEGQLVVVVTNTVTIQGNVGVTNGYAGVTNSAGDYLETSPRESTNTVRGLAFVSDPIPLLVDATATAYAANDLWADIITVTNVFTYTNNPKAIITAIKLLINQDSSPAVTFIPMARAWTMGTTNAANVTPSSEMNYAGVPISFTSSDIKDIGTNRIGFKTGLNIQVTSTNRNLLFMSIADDTTGMSNQTSTITVMGYIDQDPAQ